MTYNKVTLVLAFQNKKKTLFCKYVKKVQNDDFTFVSMLSSSQIQQIMKMLRGN